MATPALSNMSSDLVWEIVRNNNCFLSKSNRNGGVQFSHDPLNLTNVNNRKHAGFVNAKAVGIVPYEKGGITVISKKITDATKPAKAFIRNTHDGNKSNRKTYRAVANLTAKSSYRPDLRSAAVERASAIRRSQRPVKAEPKSKLRGKKAKIAEGSF